MVTQTTEAELLEKLLTEETGTSAPRNPTFKEIIHRGDASFPAPIVLQVLTDAGKKMVYHVETGEKRYINRNQLMGVLRKRREDGGLAFSLAKPEGVEPYIGSLKCLLHKDRPERSTYDRLGLPLCASAHFPSEYAVETHMQHRHKESWAIILREQERAKELRQQEFQQALVKSVQGQQPLPGGVSSPSPAQQRMAHARAVKETKQAVKA